MVELALVVDHAEAQAALERVDGRAPGNPEVDIHLSDPDDQGLALLTISGPGSYHTSPETVGIALGLQPQPEIKKYTPTNVGMVVNEPGRPPSPAAVAASLQPKGRIVQVETPKRPAEQANLVAANPPQKKRAPRKPGKKR